MSGSAIPVRWRDLDPLGHVNASVFLTYLEAGRDIWLRDVLGASFGPEQYAVARVELDFGAEIPAGTPYVSTEHAVLRLGRASITLAERLLHPDGGVVADGVVVLVMWDAERRSSRPITRDERSALTSDPLVR